MRILVWLTSDEIEVFNFTEEQRSRLADALPEAEVLVAASREEFLELLPRAEIAAVWRFEQEWLERSPRLEWLVTPAAGRDYFHVDPPDGLTLEYCSFHGQLIAETVIGMLLAHARGIRESEIRRPSDPWPRRELSKVMKPLRGSHVVILGFGNIGRWIARLAKAFGVRITGIRRVVEEKPAFLDENDSLVAIENSDDALREADYVVLALPGTPDTDRILDARRIGLLPTRAVVVNVGRGNAIDESALAEALRERSIAAAYLDVFEREPMSADHPLRSCGNAFLMPHASAFSPNYLTLFVDEFIEKYRRRYG